MNTVLAPSEVKSLDNLLYFYRKQFETASIIRHLGESNYLLIAEKSTNNHFQGSQIGKVKPSYNTERFRALCRYTASLPEGERYLVATQKELQEALEDESYAPKNGPLIVWAIGYNPAYRYYDFTPVVSYQPR